VINNLPEAGRATFGGGGKGFTVNVKMLDVSLPLPPVILSERAPVGHDERRRVGRL